jgi:hypothetical protein
MRLRALDQIAISSVKSTSLRPGEAFEVSDALGADLLKGHPGKFARIDGMETKADTKPANKAEQKPANKAEPKPGNKASSTSARQPSE